MREKVINARVNLKGTSATRNRDTVLDTPLSVAGCVLLYVILLLESPLETFVPGFNYFDEAIFIGSSICACLVLWHRKEHLRGRLGLILVLSLVVVLIGLAGNVFNIYQRNAVAIVSEIIAFLKFPFTLVAFIILLENVDCDRVIDGCACVSRFFILLCFVFCLINIVVPTAGLGHDMRNGVLSFRFIYSHPTFLVLSLVMSFAVLEAQKGGVSVWKILCLFVMAMTMRDKGFGFIAFVAFMWIFKIYRKKRLFKYFLLAGGIVLIAVSSKIAEYMSFSNSPREALYAVTTQIALSAFPFGGGFASIASPLSGRYYSNAYFLFGLSDMDGLTPLHYYDTGDAGVPYYLGQFGFIGLFFAVVSIVLLVSYLFKLCPAGSSRRGALISLIGYIVIAITVETVLSNASGLMIAILMAIIAGGKHCRDIKNFTE